MKKYFIIRALFQSFDTDDNYNDYVEEINGFSMDIEPTKYWNMTAAEIGAEKASKIRSCTIIPVYDSIKN